MADHLSACSARLKGITPTCAVATRRSGSESLSLEERATCVFEKIISRPNVDTRRRFVSTASRLGTTRVCVLQSLAHLVDLVEVPASSLVVMLDDHQMILTKMLAVVRLAVKRLRRA